MNTATTDTKTIEQTITEARAVLEQDRRTMDAALKAVDEIHNTEVFEPVYQPDVTGAVCQLETAVYHLAGADRKGTARELVEAYEEASMGRVYRAFLHGRTLGAQTMASLMSTVEDPAAAATTQDLPDLVQAKTTAEAAYTLLAERMDAAIAQEPEPLHPAPDGTGEAILAAFRAIEVLAGPHRQDVARQVFDILETAYTVRVWSAYFEGCDTKEESATAGTQYPPDQLAAKTLAEARARKALVADMLLGIPGGEKGLQALCDAYERAIDAA